MLWAILFSLNAQASATGLDLHLNCAGAAESCIDLPYQKGGTLRVQEKPVLALTPDDFLDMSSEKDEYGLPVLRLHLNSTSSEALASVTKNNFGRTLAIVVDGKIYSAPTIRQEIKGGNLQITAGGPGSELFWEKIPWMAERLNAEGLRSRAFSRMNIALYIGVALALIFGGLLFIFRRR